MQGAEPFAHRRKSRTGVLLLHGFTASPQALQELGARLREAGFASAAPLLPGHGTTVEELNRTTWLDIEAAADAALGALAEQHDKVVVVGESSGGSIALRLAAHHPDLVDGVATVGGSLLFPQEWFVRLTMPVYSWIKSTVRKMRRADVKDRSAIHTRVAYTHVPLHAFNRMLAYNKLVRADCPRVRAPLLVMQALHDHSVSPRSANVICDSASSSYKKIIWYPESYHIVLIDLEKEQAFRDIVEFVRGVDAGTLGANVLNKQPA